MVLDIHKKDELMEEWRRQMMILKMLERGAKQFRPEIWLVQEQERLEAGIDKTGTLTLGETHEANRELAAWVGEQRKIQGI